MASEVHWTIWVSFAGSIVSITLAVIAIWLGIHFKGESDRVNVRTQQALDSIQVESRVITRFTTEQSSVISQIALGQIVGNQINEPANEGQ